MKTKTIIILLKIKKNKNKSVGKEAFYENEKIIL